MTVTLVVVASALIYLCLLFSFAIWADKGKLRFLSGHWRATTYALSLGVYCTSWTFYGSVELASRTGFDFLATYVGPIILISAGYPFIMRVIRLAKAQNTTSIADFLAARYGKSERVAALVCMITLVGCVPYIALQLKAVSASLEIFLVAAGTSQASSVPVLGDIALLVALVMAGFAIAFGTRHAEATEHQGSLVAAISLESVVKLAAFLTVGIYVTFFLFDGIGGLKQALAEHTFPLPFPPQAESSWTFVSMSLLAACAFLMLPRQFHMMVVENRAIADVKRAAWLFPLYLVLINLFVLPVALGGLTFLNQSSPNQDMAILALPLAYDMKGIALIAFLGGFSAATMMVIAESVALAIMVSNHLIMPIVLRFRSFNGEKLSHRFEHLRNVVLTSRRIVIVVIALLGYGYYRLAGEASLSTIGLLTFAAIAQILPAFLGGLFWSRATAQGASAGLIIGFLTWAYTLFLPSLVEYGPWASILTAGPFGIAALKPTGLLGVTMSPLVHGVAWSLGLNLLAFVFFSFMRSATPLEKLQANAFVGNPDLSIAPSLRLFRANITIEELRTTIARYLGEERTNRAFADFAREHGQPIEPQGLADSDLLRFAEHLLASAIGSSSSRLALSLLLRRRNVSTKTALKLLDDASAAIQHSRDLLQHALDHVQQGITVIDKNYRMLAWNRAFTDLCELPPDFIRVGVTAEDFVRFTALRGSYGPGPVEEIVALRLQYFGQTTEPVRMPLYPSGKVIEIRSNKLPDGGFVTTYTDVTHSVAAEEENRRANEILEQRVRLRTEELTHLNEALSLAKAEAEEANISKTRFLAAASHDILQPLNAARLYVTSLVERDRHASDASLAENIDASLDAVEEILTALLDISRLDTGAMKPHWSVFPIAEIFKQLNREFEPVARETDLQLTFVDSSLNVRSDRRLLRRLLQNLVSNAVKYTPSGRVLIGARKRDDKVVIEVWDTGIGIPASKQKIVFHEFQRLEQGAKVARGLGLGLSIVERIARVLDHPLRLNSEPGYGTVFRVEVPVAAALPKPIGGASQPPTPVTPLAGLRVLAVDNEPSILAGMQGLLSAWGCEVTVAVDLKSALEAIREKGHEPQVILADYHLDQGDGLNVIRSIRWKLKYDVPAVLVTADRSPSVRDAATAINVHVLNKPLKPATLRALLAQWRVTTIAAE